MNPLLEEFNTAPFSKITVDDYKPAFQKAIDFAKQEIEQIVSNSEEPTFKNTTESLDYTGKKLDRISSIFFNLNAAETSKEIQEIAKEVSPWLSEFKNDMILNEALFQRVKAVYDQKKNLDLSAEQYMLLEKQYKGFSRNGANLNDTDKEQLRKIDAELSKLSIQFGERVLADTNAFELHLTDEKDLSGLPEGIKEAAQMTAKERGKEGWVFTLDYPSYIPFMTYADNRELRKTLSIAAGKKGFQQNENNTEQIILDIVKLRNERANLLGYKTHAHFVLEERMAETPEKVLSFLDDLKEKAKPAAEREFAHLQN